MVFKEVEMWSGNERTELKGDNVIYLESITENIDVQKVGRTREVLSEKSPGWQAK